MSSQAQILIDSAATLTLTDTCVVPVLLGAVTGTGSAIGAQIALSDLKTFFEGGTANEFTLTTALATPSALSATQFTGFASTVSGATLMGYGTTGDVTLKNRSGTDVIVVTSNTLNVTMAGALALVGALSGVTTIALSGAATQTVAQKTAIGTTPGTAGSDTTWTPGQGGNTTIITTGVGGKGAGWTITTGAGGTAAVAATAGTGGAGGDLSLTTGAGAASVVTGTGTGTGGKGGAIALLSGVGGAVSTSTGVNLGGASGAITFTTSAGGASTNGSTNTGGASGVITLQTGNGGAGATAAGNSGAITLQTGTAGSGGTVGSIILAPGGVTNLTATSTALTLALAVRVNAASSLGTAAGTDLTTIDGTAFGAGAASLRMNGLTTAAVNNQVGTLTNAPSAGNPAFWMPISIAGTVRYVPCWA